jgi:hypothetical protein
MTISVRSKDGQVGYVDGFRGLSRTAREWLEAGHSFEEFVVWAQATARLMPPGSYEASEDEGA